MIPTIIQGTTPTHTFLVPFDPSIIKSARFVYEQNGEVKVVKNMEDIKVDDTRVSTTLSQEDTYKLEPGITVELRLRALCSNGEALVSECKWLLCVGLSDKEVLT